MTTKKPKTKTPPKKPPSKPTLPIGTVVRRLREARKMSQEVLVDRVGDGYSTSNLSRFERDEQDIARDKLERLADALDTPLSLIYAEAELLKASETRPTLARAMVDLNQIQDIKVKAEVISLVSAIRNETIPKDRFEAALTLLLNR